MLTKAFTLIELLVAVGIVVVLSAILLGVYTQSKKSAKDVESLSNMRQLGQAANIYSESSGAWPGSARYLVDAKLVPKELLRNANDLSEKGLGNMAIIGNYNGGAPPLTDYKLSYGGFLEWEISPVMQRKVIESDGGGWLVDLSRSEFSSDARGLLFSNGVYRRLLFDSAVVVRNHYSANFDGGEGRTAVMLFADKGEELAK